MALMPFGGFGGLGGDIFGGLMDPFAVSPFGSWGDLMPATTTTAGTRRGMDLHPVDIEETDTSYEIFADAPGLAANEVNVDVSDDKVLTIRGDHSERKQEGERGGRRYRSERVRRSFVRSFTLPDNVDVNSVNANLENGVLNVSIKKTMTKIPERRRIQVRGGGGAQGITAGYTGAGGTMDTSGGAGGMMDTTGMGTTDVGVGAAGATST